MNEIGLHEERANRTLHGLSNGFAYYNYEGAHFRVFKCFEDGLRWLDSCDDNLVIAEFEDEDSLDVFLDTLKSSKPNNNIQVFLVYSTDEYLSAESFELEGVTSTLQNAHEVVKKILSEYGDEAKAVIKTTELDSNSFDDFEIYDYNYGLEWKSKMSDTEIGFLAHETN